jgi:MFS family permease
VAPLYTRSFVSLLLAQAAFGYSFSSFFLLPKFVTTELGAGPAQIGLVMAAFGATSVIFIPLVGSLVDRLGRKRFMTSGAILMSITALAFVRVHDVGPLIYLLRGVQGIAFAMTFIASATLVTDQAPPERMGQALGVFGVSMLSMHAIAPAIAEELATRWGWNPVFETAAAAALTCALLTYFVREPAPSPEDGETLVSLLSVARRPRSLRIAAVVALSGAAFGAMMTYPQPFSLALGRTHVRGFFIAYALAAAFIRLGFGSLPDRLGRDRVSVLALVAYGFAVLAMASLRPWLLEPIGAFFGLAHGLFYPAFNALAVETAGPHERGKVMAIFNGAFNLGNSGATLLLGFLAAAAGYPAVFIVAAAGVFVAVGVLIRSPEGRYWRGGAAAEGVAADGKTARVS